MSDSLGIYYRMHAYILLSWNPLLNMTAESNSHYNNIVILFIFSTTYL